LLKLSTEGAGLYAGMYRCCRKEDIRQKLGPLYREKCEKLRAARAIRYLKTGGKATAKVRCAAGSLSEDLCDAR